MERSSEGVMPSPDSRKAHSGYVVGFLFSESGDQVILIEKRRPEWQAGRYNGVGGKIEPGESAAAAMAREGVEEIGVNPEWSAFACVEYREHVLHLFAARDQLAFLDARAQTDEDIVRSSWLTTRNVIPNLSWLIPLARHHVFYEKIILAHLYMSGSGGAVARKM